MRGMTVPGRRPWGHREHRSRSISEAPRVCSGPTDNLWRGEVREECAVTPGRSEDPPPGDGVDGGQTPNHGRMEREQSGGHPVAGGRWKMVWTETRRNAADLSG